MKKLPTAKRKQKQVTRIPKRNKLYSSVRKRRYRGSFLQSSHYGDNLNEKAKTKLSTASKYKKNLKALGIVALVSNSKNQLLIPNFDHYLLKDKRSQKFAHDIEFFILKSKIILKSKYISTTI